MGTAAAQEPGAVHVTRVDGAITPVVADHVRDVIQTAALADAPLVVIELDTPGGLETSMRAIVQDILAAPVPVAVHITPPGARGASAGSVITVAAHVAAMAPGTNIGAATPIRIDSGQVLDKVVNDTAAYVEALAELRGRNAQFHVDTVVDGRSASASEAREVGAIDVVVDDLDALLVAVQEREVDVTGRGVIAIDVAGAPLTRVDLSPFRALLQRLADPDLAFVLISLGAIAVVIEIATPSGGIGGAIGAILLVLGFVALSVLPFNLAGLLLVLVAAALFVGEAFIPGVGAFAGGGALSLLVAGLLLFRGSGLEVSAWLAVAVALVGGAAGAVAGAVAVRTRNAPPMVGTAGTVVGAVGVVRDVDGPTAQVLVGGARWQAVATEPLSVGMPVRVVAMDGLQLTVETEPGHHAT